MLIFEDVDREKEVLVELSSIVAIEESNHGKNSFLYLNGGKRGKTAGSGLDFPLCGGWAI